MRSTEHQDGRGRFLANPDRLALTIVTFMSAPRCGNSSAWREIYLFSLSVNLQCQYIVQCVRIRGGCVDREALGSNQVAHGVVFPKH